MRNHPPRSLHSLSPSLSLFFFSTSFFFSLIFHGVHSNFSAICDPHSPPFLCGGVKIRYPFWNVSDDAPVHCGYPGLGIACPHGSDHPVLSLKYDDYFVTDINYDNETLTLVDVDIAIAGDECPRARHNLTLGPLPLNYSSANVNLTFFFNCTAPPAAPMLAQAVVIDCLRSGDNQSYVFVNRSPEEVVAFDKELRCEDAEVVPVKRTDVTAGTVAGAFARAMSEGFVLDWGKAKECGECEHSGGSCGVNEKEQLLCFCDDGSIHNNGSFCKIKEGGLTKERGFCLFIFSLILRNGFCILFASRRDCLSNARSFSIAGAWIPA